MSFDAVPEMMTDDEIKKSRELCANITPQPLDVIFTRSALRDALDTIEEMRKRIREVCSAYSDGNENAGPRGENAIDRLAECLK